MMSADSIWVPGSPVVDFNEQEMLQALSSSPFAEKLIDILHEARELFAETAEQV